MPAVLSSPAARRTPVAVPPLHPHIWRAQSLASVAAPALPTGHAALDAQLPGGGWPAAGLVELLQGAGAQHDLGLLLPVLAELTRTASGPVVLVGAPVLPDRPLCLQPFGPALAAHGLSPARLLWVQTGGQRDEAAARLWACEQALRCADVLAVLAWLPRCTPGALRRLHVGAMEHTKPLWALRPVSARHASSAAPLRLLLEGTDTLQVHVLKRRGPPLQQPVQLPAHAPHLAATLAARRGPSVPGTGIRPARAGEGADALARLALA